MLGSNPGPHVCVTSVSLTKAFPWPLKQCFGVEKLLLSQRPTHSLQQNNNNKKIIQKHNYLKKGLKIHFLPINPKVHFNILPNTFMSIYRVYQQVPTAFQSGLLVAESTPAVRKLAKLSRNIRFVPFCAPNTFYLNTVWYLFSSQKYIGYKVDSGIL